MFIQTEDTPNPNTLKFIPGESVLGDDTAFFVNADEAEASPLAKSLFETPNIRAVFFGSDFITITKSEDADWSTLKPGLLTKIMDHYVAGLPMMSEGTTKEQETIEYTEEEEKIVAEIKELIETRVRPAVAQDGGDIIFHSFQKGIVRLELHGACSGCPSSTITLKQGIENMLKHYVPEVMAVEAVA
ncbi:MAG: NifU family protein [Rickettsiales bacterium]|nr:NifU family protein [Rickettsiales bacterium]